MANKSIFDDELILPGVITEIVNDYNAGYDTSEFGTTDAVTIIGTAFNGPVGVPVPRKRSHVFADAGFCLPCDFQCHHYPSAAALRQSACSLLQGYDPGKGRHRDKPCPALC